MKAFAGALEARRRKEEALVEKIKAKREKRQYQRRERNGHDSRAEQTLGVF